MSSAAKVMLVFHFNEGHPITIAAPKDVADECRRTPPLITHPQTGQRIRLAFNDVTADFRRGALIYTFYQQT